MDADFPKEALHTSLHISRQTSGVQDQTTGSQTKAFSLSRVTSNVFVTCTGLRGRGLG